MGTIKLPKKYKGAHKKYHGKYMVSWSQVETWIGKRGFNTGLPGFHEYMRKYFMGETYPDMGWGQYGTEMEAFITLHSYTAKQLKELPPKDVEALELAKVNFTKKEQDILKTIKPLGNFQTEIVIDFGDFILLGFIDDHSDDYLHLRDYKSKSANTAKPLSKPDNYQLDIYALYCERELHILPTKLEYLVVERAGGGPCMKGGGRAVLSVGENIWHIDREVSEARLKKTENLVGKSVKEISDYWKTFQKFNK